MKEIKVTVMIKTPTVPNFFVASDGKQTFPVCAISLDGLREIGRRWTEDLIIHAQKQSRSIYTNHG